jgi:hypothetical protein
LNAGKFVSDRTPGRARLSAGCRPIGSRDRTKAAPESYLLHDLPGLSFDFCVTNIPQNGRRLRGRATGSASMAAAAPTIRSRSPFGHLSKLAAIRAGSRKTGADAAAFPAPDADTRCTQLDVGEEYAAIRKWRDAICLHSCSVAGPTSFGCRDHIPSARPPDGLSAMQS